MDAGLSGLPGQHAPEFVEQETRPGKDLVQIPAQHLMAETVREKMSK